MKVRALKMFNDLQSNRLRKAGEEFEVSQKRLEEINSSHNEALIVVIEEDKKQENIKGKSTKK
jgi:hypothetical protein